MSDDRSLERATILIAVSAVAVILALGFAFREQFEGYGRLFQSLGGLATILAVGAVVSAVVQVVISDRNRLKNDRTRLEREGRTAHQQRLSFLREEVRVASEYMRLLYGSEFDDVRRRLRKKTSLMNGADTRSELPDDLVRFLNIMETVAIAVQNRTLRTQVVRRMFGKILEELHDHDDYLKLQNNDQFSYEGITGVLIPRCITSLSQRSDEDMDSHEWE